MKNQKLSIHDYQIRGLLVKEDQIDKNLYCGICKELVLDGKECVDCQHLFCTNCILEWKWQSNQCPFKCSGPIKLKEPHRYIKNILDTLQVKCTNHLKGCPQITTIEQFMHHISECEFEEFKCQNKGCQEIIMKKDLESHQQKCQFKTWICNRCQESILFKEQNDHDCIKYLSQMLQTQNKLIQQLVIKLDDSEKQHQLEVNQLKAQIKLICIENQQQQHYFCKNNHKLSWTQGSFGEKCVECGKGNSIIRYICFPCHEHYCQKCRVPLLSHGRCPLNHKLQLQNQPNMHIFCDFCGRRPTQLGMKSWSDEICDFDICDECRNLQTNKHKK